MFPELKRLIEQMGKDRGIDREIIVKALEDAMLTAARKKLGPDVELEARYNEEAGEIEVFQFKTVMEKVLDPETQVSLTEADARWMRRRNRATAWASRLKPVPSAGSPFRPPNRSSSSV